MTNFGRITCEVPAKYQLWCTFHFAKNYAAGLLQLFDELTHFLMNKFPKLGRCDSRISFGSNLPPLHQLNWLTPLSDQFCRFGPLKGNNMLTHSCPNRSTRKKVYKSLNAKSESVTGSWWLYYGPWQLHVEHGSYIVDHSGYMWIMAVMFLFVAVICTGVGARDAVVSKNLKTSMPPNALT